MRERTANLCLDKIYEIDVYILLNENKNPTKAQLFISQDSISLKIYSTPFNFDFNYEFFTCEYGNYKIDLMNLECINYSTDFYSHTKDIVYIVEKVLFKEYCVNDKYNKLIIKSKDINQWVGFTELQRTLGFEIQQRLFNQHAEQFRFINCNHFKFNIKYEINTKQDTTNGNIAYTFLPLIELEFNKNLLFTDIEKIYFELLNLFYLLLGFNLNVEKVIFQSDNETDKNSYYFYKKDFKKVENNGVFISLANDLLDQYRQELNLKIFSNYFALNDYQKSFFNAFRRYKMFHYTEEKFVGYFRILENIMFDNEVLSEEDAEILLTTEMRDDLKKYAINKCKNKKLKSQDCISYIKFILFYNNLADEIQDKLICSKEDIRKIVKLRNDISHFNEYNVHQNDLEKYIDYLDFFTTYALLKFIGYTEQEFIDNLFFYPLRHKV